MEVIRTYEELEEYVRQVEAKATWNTFLGMPLNEEERCTIGQAYAGLDDTERQHTTDGVGLTETRLDETREAVRELEPDGDDKPGGSLSERMGEAERTYLDATRLTTTADGRWSRNKTELIALRVPVDMVRRMDETGMTRSECVRTALGYAANAGLLKPSQDGGDEAKRR